MRVSPNTKLSPDRGVNLVGNLGYDDRLFSCPNFLLAKLAVLKHQTL